VRTEGGQKDDTRGTEGDNGGTGDGYGAIGDEAGNGNGRKGQV